MPAIAVALWPDSVRFLRRTGPGQEADHQERSVKDRNRCIAVRSAPNHTPQALTGASNNPPPARPSTPPVILR